MANFAFLHLSPAMEKLQIFFFFILVLSIGQKYGDDICFLPDTFPLKCLNVGFKQFEEYSMQVILCVGPMPPLDDSE